MIDLKELASPYHEANDKNQLKQMAKAVKIWNKHLPRIIKAAKSGKSFYYINKRFWVSYQVHILIDKLATEAGFTTHWFSDSIKIVGWHDLPKEKPEPNDVLKGLLDA